MTGKSFNRARAEGILPPRRSKVWSEPGKAREQTIAGGEARRNFASAALERALTAALTRGFNTRKQEEGLSYAKLGRRCGRHREAVRRAMQGRDWRLSTLSDLAEALELRLEFAFADRKDLRRRFTSSGVEYAPIDPAEGAQEADR